jgi:hypothetical protein
MKMFSKRVQARVGLFGVVIAALVLGSATRAQAQAVQITAIVPTYGVDFVTFDIYGFNFGASQGTVKLATLLNATTISVWDNNHITATFNGNGLPISASVLLTV